MMSWIWFVLGLPIVVVGFLFEWMHDMFKRGRAFYEYLDSL